VVRVIRRFTAVHRFDPHLDPEDRLDAVLGAGLGETHCAVKTVVIG
jgi:hypothetical protein